MKGNNMKNMELGKIGEDMAADVLRSKGYQILRRNFRCGEGEIDIIAERYGELCFIEVKTRQSFHFGRPCEAVSREKRSHIRRVAGRYLEEMKSKGYIPRRIDFQIIEIVVEHSCHAF
ncbi:MAG: YraN family protein [Firmicutes bacterium]|nr:YraN family protein [Bacillota bacterium]